MFYEKRDINHTPYILPLMVGFYILLGMDHMLSNEYFTFVKSAQKLRSDIKEYQSMFNNQLMAMVKDYTYLAIFGEARYTPYRAKLRDNEQNIWWFFASKNHDTCYTRTYYKGFVDTATKYSKESIPQFAMTCFNSETFKWDRAYGGKKWFEIAKSLTITSIQNSPVLYLDHAFDLQHNSGVYLDKGAGIFAKKMTDVSDFLDYKRYTNIFQIIGRYAIKADAYTLKLARRFLRIMETHLRLAYNYNNDRGNYQFEEYRWGVPIKSMLNAIDKALESEEKLKENNTSIYWLERYIPKEFGKEDATKLIYVPTGLSEEELENKIDELGTDHLVSGSFWETHE